MSAFICSDMHIATIAFNVAKHYEIDSQILADRLKAVNIASVNYRYNEKSRKTKCNMSLVSENLSCDDIAALIDCWGYQSCEDASNIDYWALDSLLNRWVSEVSAVGKNSKLWSI